MDPRYQKKTGSRFESLCLLVRTISGNHIANVTRASRNSRSLHLVAIDSFARSDNEQ